MTPEARVTRRSIIDACLALNARGVNQGTSGNISLRAGPDALLITPSGVPYEQMTPEQIVTIPVSDAPDPTLRPKPSSEWRFHQRLMQTRRDIGAVVHCHPPYATAVAVQGRPIPACHYMVAAFGGADVPIAPYALFGSVALSDSVAAIMGDRDGCLMANHGAITVGDTLERALWRMEELEALARTYLFSQIGGAPVILSDEQIAEALVAFASYGPGADKG
jgi:L-fuculose-phosphate aldolase